ncbi:MAG: DUF885 domain-containing protein [Verrucomicrobiales bacterium]|nr:DUF885 domain-containing protein [Verrucomicrobiales bacterium]|tara:strand:- start:6995 stop:8602 length:1608 start_codon:yes stop_codon:yes gene_type:complete
MSERTRFEGLLDRYFEGYLKDNPMAASAVGIRDAEGKLGRANQRSVEREHKRRLKTLAELDTINPRELSNDQHLDRLALQTQLLREVEDHDRGVHRLNPEAPEALMNSLLHELMRDPGDSKRAASNLRSLLKQVPRFLSESAEVADRPESVWRKVMEEGCAGAPSLFDAVDTFLQRNEPKRSDANLTRAAGKAITAYRDKMKKRKLAPASSFAVGKEILQRRVRDEIGLDYSLGQLEALANAEAERIGGLLKKACSRYGRGKSADAIIAKARGDWDPGEDLLGHYRDETKRVANAFKSAKAVTFPKSERLEVRLVPDFMRHLFPTAAYSSPGAFEKKQKGTFWVNDLSLVRDSAKEKLAERQQHFGVSLTSAHEAYPGHHLQFVTANRHPRRWRRMFAYAVFYEGWTLWCEQMLVDLKIDRSPWTKIQQLHDALWRVHRILVDLRLQTGRYAYHQAAAHLEKHLGFTRARAEAEINWYSMAPGIPMSYWLGRLENARLHRRLVNEQGWSLKKFNDWLLSYGTIPQGWIERYGSFN